MVKLANKFGDLVNTLTAESDSLSEELLRLYKSLESNDDVEAIECSVMALRNTVKSFVILQRGMVLITLYRTIAVQQEYYTSLT